MGIEYTERATLECIESTFRGYVEAALWSSSTEDGTPLDYAHDVEDVAPETLDQMRQDVTDFLAACWGDVWEDFSLDLSSLEPPQIGHDLWLTRNGHGAGFWDRGLGELGDQLTTLAKASGSYDLYVGDDGQIWGE